MNEMKSNCERETDLVSYLYGELDATAAPSFEQHLSKSSSCSAELAGFKSVRESVVGWRNESLGLVGSGSVLQAVPERKRSAITAVRQFFDLSPLWMKGALTVAALLLCLLAGFGIVQWQRNVEPVVVKNGYSQAEVDKMIASARQEEHNKANVSTPQPENIAQQVAQPRVINPMAKHSGAAKPQQKDYARRPLARTEREQLASDLRLLSNDRDIDLLDDNINQ
jgi:hypothetical protein